MRKRGGPSGKGLPALWRMTAPAPAQRSTTAIGGNSYHARLAPPAAGFSPWDAVADAAASLGMARMRPLHYYLLGASSWFLAFGMQTVLFAWLVTMVLRESPEMVGVAQMTLLLPGTLLILAGGAFADRYGGRRMAVAGQSAAILAPLMLLLLVASGRLTFAGMLLYAAVIGCAQAFVTPARDALLNQVAGGRVQRTVMQVSAAQFGTQIVGILFASLADDLGAAPILGVQVVILAAGVLAFLGIDNRRQVPGDGRGAAAGLLAGRPRPTQGRSEGVEQTSEGGGLGGGALPQLILEGLTAVLRHRALRLVALQNVAMGLFLMGAYIVTLPVMVREVFQGSAADLSLMNSCNLVGLVLAILLLLRRGDVVRQGRALILAQWGGALVLILLALAPNYPVFLVVLFFWGASAGVAMSIARTIMQEQAPEALRGRVMAFSALSFIGAGPLGALLNGYLAEQFGAQAALGIAGAGMVAVMLAIGFRSPLWRMRADAAP